jgi:hypothetical protein
LVSIAEIKGNAIYILTAFLGRKMSLTLEQITTDITPVVEIDTEAPAAYVRLTNKPVSRTIILRDDDIVATMDVDCDGGSDISQAVGR